MLDWLYRRPELVHLEDELGESMRADLEAGGEGEHRKRARMGCWCGWRDGKCEG